jgi:hypothetical protein
MPQARRNVPTATERGKYTALLAMGKANGKRHAVLAMANRWLGYRASSPLKGARVVEVPGKKNSNAGNARARENKLAASATARGKFSRR